MKPRGFFIQSILPGVLTAIVILAAPASAQMKFESADVRIHPMTPGTYLIKDFPHAPPFVIPSSPNFRDTAHVEDLIMEAYGITGFQILYLPAFGHTQNGTVYDIQASAGTTTPTPAQFQEMLQSLLADRFHLKTHWETKPKYSVYELVVDKAAPKFHQYQGADAKTAQLQTNGQPYAGTTMFALARFLSQNLDFPVIDKTGLAPIRWDFSIDNLISYHEMDREENSDPAQAQQYLRTAVQHQLGLRLDSKKDSIEFLIIDHIDELPQK